VRNGGPCIGETPAQRLAGFITQLCYLSLKLLYACLDRRNLGVLALVAAFIRALGVQGLRALGTIAVNGYTLEAIFQAWI